MILALDTSTDWCSVALYDPTGGVRAEQTWGRRDQTRNCCPRSILAGRVKLTLGDVTQPGRRAGAGVVYRAARGPGDGQGAGGGPQLPLWGVPTLDILGYAHSAITAAPVCAVWRRAAGGWPAALYRTSAGAGSASANTRTPPSPNLRADRSAHDLRRGEIWTPATAPRLRPNWAAWRAWPPPRPPCAAPATWPSWPGSAPSRASRTISAALQAIYLQMPTPVARAAPRAPPEPKVKRET